MFFSHSFWCEYLDDHVSSLILAFSLLLNCGVPACLICLAAVPEQVLCCLSSPSLLTALPKRYACLICQWVCLLTWALLFHSSRELFIFDRCFLSDCFLGRHKYQCTDWMIPSNSAHPWIPTLSQLAFASIWGGCGAQVLVEQPSTCSCEWTL